MAARRSGIGRAYDAAADADVGQIEDDHPLHAGSVITAAAISRDDILRQRGNGRQRLPRFQVQAEDEPFWLPITSNKAIECRA